MRRRDFTINAMARRLETGEIVDPLGGREDLEAARAADGVADELRRGSAAARARAPLRLAARVGRRTSRRCEQMRDEAKSVRLVSGERVGGGLAADGMGELSKLLLGREPARALRLARDTGVLVELLPEFERAIGFDQESRYHSLTVDEHTFAVVQAAADADYSLAVRLAALFHDLGKPHVAWRGSDGRLHYYAKPGVCRQESRAGRVRACADGALAGCAIRPRCVSASSGSSATTCSASARVTRCARAAFSRSTATSSHSSCIDHKEADYRGKPGAGRRAAARGHREARTLPPRCSSRSGSTRTGSPTSRSTATT